MKESYDVIVLGGGSAGIAAAIAAAKNGSSTLLVEQGPIVGGDLLSGLPIDGCLNARGEWVVGGVIREIFDACEKRGGYIGPMSDFRALWVVCLDPHVFQFAIIDVLKKYGVDLLFYSFADEVQMEDGRITGITVINKLGHITLKADVFIDCTGDGDIAVKAGAPYEQGGADRTDLQPVSLVYSLDNVDVPKLLEFARTEPENISVGESDLVRQGRSNQELANALSDQGYAKVFFVANGPLMKKAIADGVLTATSLMATIPNSLQRSSVSINSTRIPADATQTDALSSAVYSLYEQIDQGVNFLKTRVPGFENAVFSGVAPRIGIRETRRIIGEYVLQDEDVLEARKSEIGIGKGAHEYDIHGNGIGHVRKQLRDGGSYDIPYGVIVPKNVKNLYVAGRQLSATRGAHSSARVMGTCMVMGEASGTAAAICSKNHLLTREIDVQELRKQLRAQGVVLDGTH